MRERPSSDVPGNARAGLLATLGTAFFTTTVNRFTVKQIQTPQIFNAALIKDAYKQEYNPDFTDDATVLEKIGEKINLIEGNRENIKITNPEDLLISTALLKSLS